MAGLIEKLHKIGDVINTVARVALGVTSIALCILRWWNAALPSSAGLSCYIFVWTTMLGSAVASRHLLHIGVDMVINLCHGKIRQFMLVLADVILLFALVLFTISGWNYTDSTSGNDDQGFAGALLCSPSGQRSHYDLLYICAAY